MWGNDVSEEHTASKAEYGGSIYIRNADIYLKVHAVLQPRRLTSKASPP
jgi:hypothetical protein